MLKEVIFDSQWTSRKSITKPIKIV